mgnify:FL=1
MLKNEIVSAKYRNSSELLAEIKNRYNFEKPFANAVLNNFFEDEFLNEAILEFPNLDKMTSSTKYNNKNELKLASNNFELFPQNIKKIISYLNSEEFLNFLQYVTSIKEKLIADKELNGGGIHEIKKGGYLKVHTDFHKHPVLPIERRLNILLYLNKDWQDIYGGHLQFWDRDMKNCIKKILPTFNKLVIFNTTDYSNHGHPDPLQCPDHLSRRSIATYYYSKGRPDSEIININSKNTTDFKDRVGFANETYKKKEYVKSFLRKFKFYKDLKNFEKKYLRSGSNKNK